MSEEVLYTADQVSTAARELREAAGTDETVVPRTRETGEPDQLNLRQVLSILAPEMRLLQERGFTDERIADLLIGFDIAADAGDVAASSPESASAPEF